MKWSEELGSVVFRPTGEKRGVISQSENREYSCKRPPAALQRHDTLEMSDSVHVFFVIQQLVLFHDWTNPVWSSDYEVVDNTGETIYFIVYSFVCGRKQRKGIEGTVKQTFRKGGKKNNNCSSGIQNKSNEARSDAVYWCASRLFPINCTKIYIKYIKIQKTIPATTVLSIFCNSVQYVCRNKPICLLNLLWRHINIIPERKLLFIRQSSPLTNLIETVPGVE